MIEKEKFFPIGVGTFRLNLEDMEKLNNFNHEGFDSIKIDWSETGNGVLIDQLANQF